MKGMILSIAFLFLLLFCLEAAAQDKEAAKLHFEKGAELFNEGSYAKALAEFRASYEAMSTWKIRYYIGLSLNELKDSVGAEKEFKAYLEEGAAEVPEDKKEEVEGILAKLSVLLGSIQIMANVHGAEVHVDGDFVGKTPLTQPVRKDKGKHEIVVKKMGYEDYSRTVNLTGGGTALVKAVLEKIVVAPLVEKKEKPVRPPLVKKTEKGKKAPVVSASPGEKLEKAEKRKKAGPMKKAGGALLGIGLAGLVIGAAAGGAALSQAGDLEKECVGSLCGPDQSDAIDRIDSLAWCSDVFLGVGLVAAVIGVALLATGRKRESRKPAQVSIFPGPGGIGMKWSY